MISTIAMFMYTASYRRTYMSRMNDLTVIIVCATNMYVCPLSVSWMFPLCVLLIEQAMAKVSLQKISCEKKDM